MSCDCETCKYLAEFQTRLNAIPEEHRAFFDDLMQRYEGACTDRDVNASILDGSWPSAKGYIEHAAQTLGFKLVPIDKA